MADQGPALRHLVVGTAGHIDHGKSALVQALTGTDPDRWEEEKRRGITIDLGFAHTGIGEREISFVDVPGHEKFVHNMLAGATGVDLVLLVVAADESVMPQTREHLAICDLLGAREGIIAITRCDLAEEDFIGLVEQEVREACDGTFLEDAPLVRVSARTGQGLDGLRACLERTAAVARSGEEDGPWPRLAIDRVFAAHGFGTVVTGTLHGGSLALGQALEASPGRLNARVRGLQVHSRAVERAAPRQRVAVNLQGISHDRLRRGMVLAPPGCATETRVIDAWVRVLADAPAGLEERQRVRLHHGTAEVLGRLRVGGAAIEPGREGAVQVRLEAPLVALPGDRFILRRYSPLVTLGGGRIADLAPPRHGRGDEGWKQRARELAACAPFERLRRHLAEAGRTGLDPSILPRLGLSPESAIGEELAVRAAGERLIEPRQVEQLERAVLEAVDAYHAQRPGEPGAPVAALRRDHAPKLPPAAFRALLERAVARAELALSGDRAHRPDHRAELAPAERDRLEAWLARLGQAGVQGLSEDELEVGVAERPLLEFAARGGLALRLGGERWIAGGVWEEVVTRLREEAGAGRRVLDVPRFKQLFGLSRKYAIPLLEALDDAGITRRAGNNRVVMQRDVDRPPQR